MVMRIDPAEVLDVYKDVNLRNSKGDKGINYSEISLAAHEKLCTIIDDNASNPEKLFNALYDSQNRRFFPFVSEGITVYTLYALISILKEDTSIDFISTFMPLFERIENQFIQAPFEKILIIGNYPEINQLLLSDISSFFFGNLSDPEKSYLFSQEHLAQAMWLSCVALTATNKIAMILAYPYLLQNPWRSKLSIKTGEGKSICREVLNEIKQYVPEIEKFLRTQDSDIRFTDLLVWFSYHLKESKISPEKVWELSNKLKKIERSVTLLGLRNVGKNALLEISKPPHLSADTTTSYKYDALGRIVMTNILLSDNSIPSKQFPYDEYEKIFSISGTLGSVQETFILDDTKYISENIPHTNRTYCPAPIEHLSIFKVSLLHENTMALLMKRPVDHQKLSLHSIGYINAIDADIYDQDLYRELETLFSYFLFPLQEPTIETLKPLIYELEKSSQPASNLLIAFLLVKAAGFHSADLNFESKTIEKMLADALGFLHKAFQSKKVELQKASKELLCNVQVVYKDKYPRIDALCDKIQFLLGEKVSFTLSQVSQGFFNDLSKPIEKPIIIDIPKALSEKLNANLIKIT